MFNLIEEGILIFALQHYMEWIKEGPVVRGQDEYLEQIRALYEKIIKGGK